MIDLLKDPSSFNLRERFAREIDVIKIFFKFGVESDLFMIGVKIIGILQKFNP